MFDQNTLKEAKNEIDSAKSIAILLPPDPSSDLVASGLALYLSFTQAGKQVQIGCSTQIRVENADLFGVDKIKNSVGNQNLVITFDFKEENLKKVDYDVDENGKFMLLVQPQPGCEAPDTSTITYSYSGASADLVFVLGVNSLEELGKLYADEKVFLDQAKIISLNLTSKPSNINAISLHTNSALCLSEAIGVLMKNSQVNPTADAASNLLSIVSANSNQFASPKVTADTFETVAFLMRHGGHLGRSPLASSSRFGAFSPAPMGSLMDNGDDMAPPTFDEDLPSIPSFGIGRPNRVPNGWNKRPKIFNSSKTPLQ